TRLCRLRRWRRSAPRAGAPAPLARGARDRLPPRRRRPSGGPCRGASRASSVFRRSFSFLAPADSAGEFPAMLGEVDADPPLPRADGEGEDLALVIIRCAVLRVDGGIHQIIAGAEAQGRT